MNWLQTHEYTKPRANHASREDNLRIRLRAALPIQRIGRWPQLSPCRANHRAAEAAAAAVALLTNRPWPAGLHLPLAGARTVCFQIIGNLETMHD